jgi:hypothetical protein
MLGHTPDACSKKHDSMNSLCRSPLAAEITPWNERRFTCLTQSERCSSASRWQ